MRRLLFISMALWVLAACSDVSPEWQAASAARDYYSCLTEDDVDGFMRGKASGDSLPPLYREQLQRAVGQYLSDVKASHGGLSAVRISDDHYVGNLDACRDSALQLTYAYLILCFSDSTKEEIMVPMVSRDGQWLMK